MVIRHNHKNAHYFWCINDASIKISYETNIWGEQPRYKIKLTKSCGDCGYYNLFSYYHGEINKFVAPFECVNTLTTEIDINKLQTFIDAVNWLVENKEMKCKNKLIKYINKLK